MLAASLFKSETFGLQFMGIIDMSLAELLSELEYLECFPCISLRGPGVWRAHVNGAGNYWAEASTPKKALQKAMYLWTNAGKPMDGYAEGDY